jgi:maleate isomerase
MTNRQDRPYRVGMIVPSSNTTMESEVPELLRRQQAASGDRFSFHSARLRLQQVTPEALQKMNEAADGAVDMLCDAQVDAIVYACLVAVMVGGSRCIPQTQAQLAARAAATDRKPPPVVTSAGALVGALEHLGAGRVTMITPYRKSITARVAATLGECGIRVVQSRSLEVVDNLQVGRLDPLKLLALASQLDFSGSDALVLSACVQMPSLEVIEEAEQRFGLPVVSAATASAFELLQRLSIEPRIAHAGMLLRGARAVLS